MFTLYHIFYVHIVILSNEIISFSSIWNICMFYHFQIYMINLERRRDRRNKMEKIFDVMKVRFKLVKAVDGRYV